MNKLSNDPKKIKFGLLLAILISLLLPSMQAENVITTGTTLKVTAGTTLVSVDNLVVKSWATLDNAGTLILKKNISNENALPNSLGTGSAELSGSTAQSITGQNVIQNLTVNNVSGATIGGNTNVNGNLTLTSGKVTLGSNNLLLGPSAAIVGTPSALVMIVVTGTGELRKEFPAGYAGAFTYPVGDDTGTPEYSPVTVVFTGGTFAVGNYIGVNLKNEKYNDPGITGNYLNRYWSLSQFGTAGVMCNATFQYSQADVVGTENKLSCTRVNPIPWVTYGPTNASTHLLIANSLTSFGSFTGLKSTTTPLNQQLANVVIPGGTTTCYDAVQVLTLAGSGATFLVQNNGSVTLVAGNKISMLDGTKVNSGGYMHAYITTNGIFCGSLLNPLVANFVNKETLGIETVIKNQFIKVYPNPTTDIVIVELINNETAANITVYSMQGGRLYQKDLNGENKFQFSLAGKPTGIYMVHVLSGDKTEVAKVVKN